MAIALKGDVLPFKGGVKLQPEILLAIMIADGVYASCGVRDLMITSLLDGVHSTNSLHYKGLAVDLRTKGTGLAQRLFDGVRKALPSTLYDVILENKDQENEHIHIEYDPK
jgi:hypothetical protein